MSITDCTGLKTEWTSTLETTTQFPVDPGTVVEVTCSDSYAINSGSSEITCKTGRLFNYQQEPHCTVPGNEMLFHLQFFIQVQLNKMAAFYTVFVL